ncbi:hypothetical protein ACTJI8_10090 [Microbacterium sp. 22303]|uniref:hypothetical protein n=1 Tax=Microbacterium sp. 22303 TaxID=3453905 RepID=UPI003F87D7D0
MVLLVAVTGGVLLPQAAEAATRGPSYWNDYGVLGAYVAESDGMQVYCIDSGAPSPLGMTTSAPSTVTALNSHTGQQLSQTALAQLNYVLAKWGPSSDPNVTAAVQIFAWEVADPDTYNASGGTDHYILRVDPAARQTVLDNLAIMRAEAATNASVAPTVDVEITMQDQYNGYLDVTVSPASMAGSVVLSGARFLDGSTSKQAGIGRYDIVGTPASGVPAYQVSASASYSGAGLGARVNLYSTPGSQRLLAAGTPAAATDSDQTPMISLDFQPVIGTQVASRFVAEGDAFVDTLDVSTVGMGDWIHVEGTPVPLEATGVLYGPFEEQPAESETVPAGAPVAGTETLVLDRGVGTYESPGTVVAAESGFYTWVWSIDRDQQGDAAQYIRGSFTDWFGRVAETHVTPFQPVAVSHADARLLVPGDPVTDTIEVSSSNGSWLRVDGAPVPVTFTGTAYQVPGTLPPLEQETVPADAVAIDTVHVIADGPGTYTSPEVVLPDAGFVTWVWEVHRAEQPAEFRDYIADDWADRYGIPVESTSVRHPVTITSEVREYNVHPGGRAFDTITVTGFPDNHGEFTGDGYWGADLDEITHTVYGPLAESDLTDELDLDAAPTLTTITTPARNGDWRIGYTDDDQIRPTETGYYVIVSNFGGDDRVQPYASSPADILERFYVPERPTPGWDVHVRTQAQPDALVGEEFEDVATVTGTNIPDGSYLVFRAYGPFETQPADGEEGDPFFTSKPIPVNGPGEYRSGATSVDEAGLVFWVETLYSAEDDVLASGYLGAPGETTRITAKPDQPEEPLEPTTPATPETPETPEVPSRPGTDQLASTGMDGWVWTAGIIGLVGAATGLTLLFGRALAKRREEAGYVREEDQLPPGEELTNMSD